MKTLILMIIIFSVDLFSQTFTKITDANNPVVTATYETNYSGAAWIDYNGDGNIDLFMTKKYLFKNPGNGNFQIINTSIGADISAGTVGNGVSWGDFNNDGLPDCFVAGNPSRLYRNDGNDIFTEVKSPVINNEDKRGWTCAWGDYDNDGNIDIIITHPAGFIGIPATPNHLLHNNGDETFSDVTADFTSQLAPYTVATWYDFDQDGDIDLFIGSGPASTTGKDFNYRNQLLESGSPQFLRINDSPVGTDTQNGQVWNFIDYDNDGDLDAFITNYGLVSDHFYRNDNGVYTRVDNALTTLNQGQHLANVWGDFDNDGFIDVIVTSEKGNYFYRNDQHGNFTLVNNAITSAGATRSAVVGDFNNDGKLDVFVTGTGTGRGLFRNDNNNGNHWVLFNCKGTVSNRSAIGTRIKLKASINGVSMWQYREINAQNSFNGQSDLRAHFGLGNATVIDSVIFLFPSGGSKVLTSLQPDSIYSIIEDIPLNYLQANFSADKREEFNSLHVKFKDLSVANPGNPVTKWEWDFNNDGVTDAVIQNPEYDFNSPGIYTVSLKVTNSSGSKNIIKPNFIYVDRIPGIPIIDSYTPASDTTIPKTGNVLFKVHAIDTTGYALTYKWTRNSATASSDTFYNYTSSQVLPERTDTVRVIISNQYHSVSKQWLVTVKQSTGIENDARINKFYLAQNYPNPFNPSTTIRYQIPKPGIVSLKVFDILGREVATLINENKTEGSFEYSFNASGFESGVYIFQLRVNDLVSSRKMILLK